MYSSSRNLNLTCEAHPALDFRVGAELSAWFPSVLVEGATRPTSDQEETLQQVQNLLSLSNHAKGTMVCRAECSCTYFGKIMLMSRKDKKMLIFRTVTPRPFRTFKTPNVIFRQKRQLFKVIITHFGKFRTPTLTPILDIVLKNTTFLPLPSPAWFSNLATNQQQCKTYQRR